MYLNFERTYIPFKFVWSNKFSMHSNPLEKISQTVKLKLFKGDWNTDYILKWKRSQPHYPTDFSGFKVSFPVKDDTAELGKILIP